MTAPSNGDAFRDYQERRIWPPLAERFEYQQHLPNAGAQSEVFVVRDRTTSDLVILKQYSSLRASLVPDEVLEALLSSESEHLVSLLHYGRLPAERHFEGGLFEILEFLPQGDLSSWLGDDSRSGQLSKRRKRIIENPQEFDRLVHQMALSIATFHRLADDESIKIDGSRPSSIAHRDVKPENFFVVGEAADQIRLGDYGLAAAMVDLSLETVQGPGPSRPGTELYLPPEADRDVFTYGPAMDWWAFGMVVGELALGEPLIPSTNFGAVRRRVADGDLRIEEVRDERRRNLLYGLLHPDRPTGDANGRWGYDEIERWLGGEEVPVSPPIGGRTTVDVPGAPSFAFDGQTFRNPSDLVHALSLSWRQAIPELIADTGASHSALIAWLRDDLGDATAASIAESDRAPASRLARLLARFRIDEPRFEDIDLRPTGLGQYLRDGLDGEGPDASALDRLLESAVLRDLADESNHLATLHARWRSNSDALLEFGLTPQDHHVQLVSSLVDDEYERQLLDSVQQAESDPLALTQENFRRVVFRPANSASDIARAIALHWLLGDARQAAIAEQTPNHRLRQARRSVLSRIGKDREKPQIPHLTIDPSHARSGQMVTVSWETVGAETVNVTPFGEVARKGRARLTAASSIALEATATDRYGRVARRREQLVVDELPVVRSFLADPIAIVRGQEVQLRWEVEGESTTVVIEGVAHEGVGETTIRPRQSGRVELVVSNLAGQVRAVSNRVSVLEAPPFHQQTVVLPLAGVTSQTPLVIAPELSFLSSTLPPPTSTPEKRQVVPLDLVRARSQLPRPPATPLMPRSLQATSVSELLDSDVGQAFYQRSSPRPPWTTRRAGNLARRILQRLDTFQSTRKQQR